MDDKCSMMVDFVHDIICSYVMDASTKFVDTCPWYEQSINGQIIEGQFLSIVYSIDKSPCMDKIHHQQLFVC